MSLLNKIRNRPLLSLITVIGIAAAPAYAGFVAAPFYPVRGPVAVGDFNGDAIPDLAGVTASGVTVLLGKSDGTFQETNSFAAGTSNWGAIAVGDFNGDGILDLVGTRSGENPANTVTVLLGNGDGTFQPAKSYDPGPNAFAVAVGDFNGDDILDLAVANSNLATADNGGSTVSILLGNGDGSFQAPQSYPVAGPNALSVVVGDFNEDGKLDLAVAHYQEPNGGGGDVVTILLGNGDGTFRTGGSLASTGGDTGPFSLAAADLNGDGHLDLVLCSTQPVLIFLGQGDGTFQSGPNTVGVSARGAAVGDFNGDGHPDLALSGGDGGAVSIVLGNGDGTFQDGSVTYAAGGDSILAADFNGDGHLDVAATASTGLYIMLGKGDGSLQAARTFLVNDWYVFSLAAADFNGDGKLDVVTGAHIFLGEGDGTFQLLADMPQAAGLTLAVGDFNGDGIPDFVSSYGGDRVIPIFTKVFLGKGDGTFELAQTLNIGSSSASPAVGDFNGDGIPDLAIARYSSITFFLGKGDGSFQQAPQSYAFQEGSLAVGDFNGDGKLDIVTSGGSVLLGNGDGTFQAVPSFPGPYGSSVVVADFNRDGFLDLAVTTMSGLNILLGNGDGTFQAPQNYTTEPYGGVVVGDFNQDGITDLAVVGLTVGVLLGNGDGSFQNLVHFGAPGGNSPTAGDFNGDGFPDLALANGNGVVILLNDGHWGR